MLSKASHFVACLLAAATLGTPASAQATTVPDPQLTLTESAAVAMAESLSRAIDAVSSRVAECLTDKTANAQLCFCRYPNEVSRLRAQYEAALVKFPAWQDKVLNWSTAGQKGSRSISMVGLKLQLKQACPK
jgi:hypothetical protein